MIARLILALLGAAALSACGNIRSLPLSVPADVQAERHAVPDATVTATFAVAVPASATNAKSVSISANGGAAVVHNLGPTVSGCTPPSGPTPLTCSVPVTAKTGTNTFLLKTFSGSNGTGSVLASANMLQVLTANMMIAVTLAGTAASVTLALSNTAPRECNPAVNIPLFVAVKDAGGEVIVTSNYGVTITLHDSDTTGTTTLSTTTVMSSATAVTVGYNGNLLKSATISASASGIPPANVHNAVLMPAQMLYAMDLARSAIDVFPTTANGNVAPTRRLLMTGPDNGLTQDDLTPKCTVFVSDSGSTVVAVFSFNARSNGTVSSLTKISGTNTDLTAGGVAVNPMTGMVYAPINVSGTAGIGIWPATATGNVAPTSMIIGTHTMIGNPASLAFDATGKLYVLGLNHILVFAAGATGNATPLQNLATGFFCADGVAVDGTDRIYVPDNCAAEVKVWAKGATGNATPLRTIMLPGGTANGGANGVAVDNANNMYTADAFFSHLYSWGPTANGMAPPRTTISGTNTTLFEPNSVSL